MSFEKVSLIQFDIDFRYTHTMSLRKRFTIKSGKLFVDLLSRLSGREELKIVFMYFGRNLGFGLAIPCAQELDATCAVYDFSAHKNTLVVLDVGANIGDYSQAVLQRFDKVQIHAFEPNPRTFQFLKGKFSQYSNVNVYDYAIGSEDTFGYISESRLFDPSSTVTKNPGEGSPVHILSLESFVSEKGITNIDLLKIDAEGMDLEVLLGAQKILSRLKVIQFEISPSTIRKAALKDFFEILGSTHALHILAKGGLQQIVNYDFSDEIYWGANFVAVIKE